MLARSPYQFSKRQRELAKKQKREEKLQKKLERKQGGDGAVGEAQEPEQLETTGEPEAAAETASPAQP